MNGGAPKGSSLGRLRPGGKRTQGQPSLGLEHLGRGCTEPLSEPLALSRPQESGPGRGRELMAQRTNERGADYARQEEEAAKRNREAPADTIKVARGARTRKRWSST